MSWQNLRHGFNKLFRVPIPGTEKKLRECKAMSMQEESHKGELTKNYKDCLSVTQIEK
jgi:hypothetical protein